MAQTVVGIFDVGLIDLGARLVKRFALVLIVLFFVLPVAQAAPKKVKRAPAAASPTPTPDPAAKAKGTRAPIDSANVVRINYSAPAWNKNPKEIESASLFMREGTTGRVVQIHLDEGAPDSSLFTGLFSINWRNIDKLQVEFYVPPQELLATNDGMKKIGAMIANNELKRKPFLLRRADSNMQTVEIFDSVEQAQLALRAYRSEQQLQSMQGLKNKDYPSNQEIDVRKLAEMTEQRAEAAKALAERVRIYQTEMKKIQDNLAKFLTLPIPQREARRKEAAEFAKSGAGFLAQGQYPDALEKFEKAIETDPQNRGYLYQYAICLYRVNDFNSSIVYLQVSEGEGVNEPERQYYLALNYFALKDYDNSNASFERVVGLKDPPLMGSSKFYIGVVKFEQKDWDAAQTAFQAVLDSSSSNVTLDKQAEAYLEQILRLRQIDAERSHKWQLSATIGELADTNVLLTSDSALDQGTASNSFGWRTLLMGSARYRPLYEDDNEFAVQLDVLQMYTVNQSFAADQNLRNSDPTVLTLSAPWSLKTTLFGYGYKLDLAPGYETIFMSVEDNTYKPIVSSLIMNVNNLFVISPTWFSNWNVESRKDSSTLNSSVGDNDANAFKVKLLNSNTFVINTAKDKFVTAEGAVTMNQALGRDTTYNRFDLAAGYLQPFYWDTVANAKLGYYLLTYPNHTQGRQDADYTFTFGGSKKLSETYNAGLTAAYAINNSTTDSNSYKKWTVMATLSGAWGL